MQKVRKCRKYPELPQTSSKMECFVTIVKLSFLDNCESPEYASYLEGRLSKHRKVTRMCFVKIKLYANSLQFY